MYFNKQHISEVLFKHGNMTVIDSQILSMQLLTEKVVCLKTASCCPRLHQSINEVADAGTEVLKAKHFTSRGNYSFQSKSN